MSKRELHQAMQAELTSIANKVAALKVQHQETERQIAYWTRQEEAARVLCVRLDIEADQEEPEKAADPRADAVAQSYGQVTYGG